MKVQEIQATDLPLRASAEARSASQVNMTPASSHETFRTCWGFVHKSGLVIPEESESRRETMHETLLASIAWDIRKLWKQCLLASHPISG